MAKNVKRTSAATQRKDAVAATPRKDGVTTPLRKDAVATPTLRKDGATPTPRADSKSTPTSRKDSATPTPRTDSKSTPTQRKDSVTSTPRTDPVPTPTPRTDTSTPTQRNGGATVLRKDSVAARMPQSRPSLRQRAKSEIIVTPRRLTEPSPSFLKTCIGSSPDSRRASDAQPLFSPNGNLRVSLFSEPMASDDASPSRKTREARESQMPSFVKIVLEKERADKQQLELELKELKAEMKEQLRLHEFEKSMIFSKFDQEREVMKAEKEQARTKLHNAHLYERSLIKDIKALIRERDHFKKELAISQERELISVESRSSDVCSRPSSDFPSPRRQTEPPKAQDNRRSAAVQNSYTRHMKAYARSLQQQEQDMEQLSEEQEQLQLPETLHGHLFQRNFTSGLYSPSTYESQLQT